MKKRLLAAVLWFVSGWYAGAVLAFITGLSPILAPLAGIAAAAIVAGDPRAVIWRPQVGEGSARQDHRPLANA